MMDFTVIIIDRKVKANLDFDEPRVGW